MDSQNFEKFSLDAIAAELIRSVGMQEAEAFLGRLGYNLGKNYIPRAVKLDRVSSWRDIVEQFLLSQGLSSVEVELVASPRPVGSSLVSRIRFCARENSSTVLLRPWLYAGWCSGYSANQLGKDLFFRIARVPDAK